MTSILPIRIIKARTRALVPAQKPVFNYQNKTHRAGNRTDALGEVVFSGGCRSIQSRLGLFVAAEERLRADTGSGRSRIARADAATCSGSRIPRSRCRRPVPRS